MSTINELIAQRAELVDAENNTYSPSDCPGTPRYMTHLAACNARQDFDAAHPEVFEAILDAAKARLKPCAE